MSLPRIHCAFAKCTASSEEDFAEEAKAVREIDRASGTQDDNRHAEAFWDRVLKEHIVRQHKDAIREVALVEEDADVWDVYKEALAVQERLERDEEQPRERERRVVPRGREHVRSIERAFEDAFEACCVVALIISNYADFVLIAGMLICNACIGFYEERKAQASLDGLKSKLEATVSCVRDGTPQLVGVALLVPGDVISLRGGNAIPADVEWLEGDTIKVDTAPLTGEPLPWSVPRPDKEGEPGSGKVMWAGMTVVQGEAEGARDGVGLRELVDQFVGLVPQPQLDEFLKKLSASGGTAPDT